MDVIERDEFDWRAWMLAQVKTASTVNSARKTIERVMSEAVAVEQQRVGAVEDAEHGRALVDRMFELPRGPEWEQALAELRVWSMKDHNPRGQCPMGSEEGTLYYRPLIKFDTSDERAVGAARAFVKAWDEWYAETAGMDGVDPWPAVRDAVAQLREVAR